MSYETANIEIVRQDVTEKDYSFYIRNASLIRFMNKGQTRVWIDEQEVLEPGQSWTEGDIRAKGINHRYKIDFIELPPDKTPEIDKGVCEAGNMLKVRIFIRNPEH